MGPGARWAASVVVVAALAGCGTGTAEDVVVVSEPAAVRGPTTPERAWTASGGDAASYARYFQVPSAAEEVEVYGSLDEAAAAADLVVVGTLGRVVSRQDVSDEIGRLENVSVALRVL